ncbi:putative RNA recognition motif domain, nucleotide-binding alpha-beta plait domain superfamily [Helianthus anomalus]
MTSIMHLQVLSIKVIRNKATGLQKVTDSWNSLHTLQQKSFIQHTELTFRLNWASSRIGERRPDAGPKHSIFVGDLAPDVTDHLLQETFRTQYPSVRGTKVVIDANTGRSKGYGFVKFADEMERNRAITEMNGIYCSTRPNANQCGNSKEAHGLSTAIYLPPTTQAKINFKNDKSP